MVVRTSMTLHIISILCVWCLLIGTIVGGAAAEIPIIDISGWLNGKGSNQIVEHVNQALKETGFFAITGHGINRYLIDSVLEVSRAFFEQDEAFKMQWKTTNATEYPYGYERQEILERGKYVTTSSSPDLKETWSLGPANHPDVPARRLPNHPENFAPIVERYYEAMEELATVMLEIFATTLNLPKDWFKDKMVNHMSALRTLYYYELLSKPDNNVRASPHSDYGVMTLLYASGPGLQAYVNDVWINVPSLHDAYVVNIGDMMAMWTNDLWKSTLHRVVVLDEDYPVPARLSVAYFVNVRGDVSVDPNDLSSQPSSYQPVLARDYVLSKHLASLGDEL